MKSVLEEKHKGNLKETQKEKVHKKGTEQEKPVSQKNIEMHTH